ncbi:DUF58 domain-containing protein [Luteimonas sp. FCS-9]|uniref:DUF58 domain-containing protein n=1 Tax=Luteimonas sp. FCS-9 TaxID=1547516 RepID=UPI00063E896A|nr:DUF58 domain-containing protein [Luteimonas sp. FCS-9]KLJ00409.1 von Willebrand factor A [Luteimonas sp. FCS-9]
MTPALRACLATLRLRLRPRHARGRDGLGQHASRNRGAGLEFAQYRAYEPGDEPRQIDWRLYARSDRFFVREAERESPVRAWVLLDTTASMAQADEAAPQRTRLDVARLLATCVAEIAQRQGDACGLATCGGAGVALVAPGTGPRQRDRLRHALAQATPADGWPEAATLAPVWGRIARGDLVVAIGDWFDAGAVDALLQLAQAGRDVVALQVLTADERDFPFRDGRRFVDPETGEALLGDGPALRADYLARFGAAQRALAARLGAAGIAFATHVADAPAQDVLRALFGDRAR